MVADGLPLFGGAQLAVDATLVSALKSDGTARRRAAQFDGVALLEARRRKERTYPELAGHNRRGRLVVLAVEVGVRWSQEMKCFVPPAGESEGKGRDLLDAQTRRTGVAPQVGFHRLVPWPGTVASTMLELPGARDTDGDTISSQDVEQDCRFSGLEQ